MSVKNPSWIKELWALCLLRVVVIAFFAITGLILSFRETPNNVSVGYGLAATA
jgi:hypothetical protein